MEEGQQTAVKVRYIHGDDFARYIEAKGINANCLRCGAADWQLHDTNRMIGTAALVIPPSGELDIVGRSYIPQVVLSCNNCGTMWSLSRGYVQEWLDANPAPGEANGSP